MVDDIKQDIKFEIEKDIPNIKVDYVDLETIKTENENYCYVKYVVLNYKGVIEVINFTDKNKTTDELIKIIKEILSKNCLK